MRNSLQRRRGRRDQFNTARFSLFFTLVNRGAMKRQADLRALCVSAVNLLFFAYNPPMRLIVNGQPQEAADGATVHRLIAAIGLTPQKVAIELNRRLLRSEKYDTPLKDGDEIEIVTFVGGG